MAQGYILNKGAVQTFLIEVKSILTSKNGELRIIDRNDKPAGYNTIDCRTALGIDNSDIKEYIKKLTIKDYVETCDDERNKKANAYYIFCIEIQNRQIYIKIKIQSYNKKIVLYMSFHFAQYTIKKFPYRRGE